jgi:deazaflavin-dependent oxidoreductase (nitroreductase family)
VKRLRITFHRLHGWVYGRTGGRVLGRIGGQPVLLLSTTGLRSGETRTTPVQYLRHDKAWVIVAADGGARTPPHWLRNLTANPAVDIQVGTDQIACTASVEAGDGRDALWRELVAANKWLPRVEKKAGRQLPLVVLEKR